MKYRTADQKKLVVNLQRFKDDTYRGSVSAEIINNMSEYFNKTVDLTCSLHNVI
jgi:hypothetical protein